MVARNVLCTGKWHGELEVVYVLLEWDGMRGIGAGAGKSVWVRENRCGCGKIGAGKLSM